MTSNAIDYARTVSQAKLNETQMDVNAANIDKLKAEAEKARVEKGSSGLSAIGSLFGGVGRAINPFSKLF